MTSQIAFSTIDETYPVAGQDNNSQGFRDNFSIIKTGLNTASSEITDLQNNTAKTDVDNNFNGVEIANAVLLNNTLSVSNLSTQTASFTVNTQDADVFVATVSTAADCTITFSNWPDNPRYRKITVILKSAGTQKNVYFAGTASNGRRFLNVPLVTGLRTLVIPADSNASNHLEVSHYAGQVYINHLGTFVE